MEDRNSKVRGSQGNEGKLFHCATNLARGELGQRRGELQGGVVGVGLQGPVVESAGGNGQGYGWICPWALSCGERDRWPALNFDLRGQLIGIEGESIVPVARWGGIPTGKLGRCVFRLDNWSPVFANGERVDKRAVFNGDRSSTCGGRS
jgi:hypothetical protein